MSPNTRNTLELPKVKKLVKIETEVAAEVAAEGILRLSQREFRALPQGVSELSEKAVGRTSVAAADLTIYLL